MKLLLDTHALIWFFSGDSKLSDRAKEAFLNRDNKLYFSKASFWQITIKIGVTGIMCFEEGVTHLLLGLNADQYAVEMRALLVG